MTETTEPQASPVVKVARDLREIERLHEALEVQAVHKANDRLMPGGLAMVALGGVANLEAWEHQFEAREALGRDISHVAHEDDSWEPPLQTLRFWSEAWRAEHGAEYGQRVTVASEANFLRYMLEWAWDNEPRFYDFAKDVEQARLRLEAMLLTGERPVARGVSCMYDECKGKRLIRKTVPARGANGEKVWKLTDWHCPNCKKSWDEQTYTRNVYAAVERQHWAVLDDETWCTVDRAARKVGRPQGTVRSWISRGEVSALCLVTESPIGRTTFVMVADVVERDRLAKERYAAWLAARAARMTSA